MSVTGIGASAFPTTQHAWAWQTDGPDSQNSSESTKTNYPTTDGAPPTTTGDTSVAPDDTGETNNGTQGAITNNAANGPRADKTPQPPPLPPGQAATAPGTGQKIDIIA